MKYKCKENDAIIELGKYKDELYIYIDGERSKTVVGLSDLLNALEEFGIDTSTRLGITVYDEDSIKWSDCILMENGILYKDNGVWRRLETEIKT